MIETTLACVAVLAAPQEFGTLRLDSALVATIPEGIELEMEKAWGDQGQTYTTKQEVRWSPDGWQVAYAGFQEEKNVAVVGEEVLGDYDYMNPPLFGGSGADVLFRVGNRVSKSKEKWWILINGKEFGGEDWIGDLAFSPAGDCFVYWTKPGAKITSGGAYNRVDQVFVLATRKGKSWKRKKGAKWDDGGTIEPPAFHRGGEVVTTFVLDKDKWKLMVIDREKRGKEQTFGNFMSPMISVAMNARGNAWAATNYGFGPQGWTPEAGEARWSLICGERELGRAYDAAGLAVYSPKDDTLAYRVRHEGKMGIVVGDDEDHEPQYDYVYAPVWSPDAKRIAYAVNEGVGDTTNQGMYAYWDEKIGEGEVWVVQHGTKGKREVEEGARYAKVRHVTFGPKSRRLAYAAKTQDGWTMVVDEEAGEAYDAVGEPRFSKDGKHDAHGARRGRELHWIVR